MYDISHMRHWESKWCNSTFYILNYTTQCTHNWRNLVVKKLYIDKTHRNYMRADIILLNKLNLQCKHLHYQNEWKLSYQYHFGSRRLMFCNVVYYYLIILISLLVGRNLYYGIRIVNIVCYENISKLSKHKVLICSQKCDSASIYPST